VGADGNQLGPIHLFFGCRYRDRDRLYGDEIDDYHVRGVLASVTYAWSREQQKKAYVQDRLLQNGKWVWNVLNVTGSKFVLAGCVGNVYCFFKGDDGCAVVGGR